MLTCADTFGPTPNTLDRLGPPRVASRPDPIRRTGLRVRLARLGGVGLRDRLTAQATVFAR